MEDMWRSRAKPTPLDFDAIREGTFTLPNQPLQHANGVSAPATSKKAANGSTNGPSGSAATESLLNGGTSTSAGLKDQRALTLRDNLELFCL